MQRGVRKLEKRVKRSQEKSLRAYNQRDTTFIAHTPTCNHGSKSKLVSGGWPFRRSYAHYREMLCHGRPSTYFTESGDDADPKTTKHGEYEDSDHRHLACPHGATSTWGGLSATRPELFRWRCREGRARTHGASPRPAALRLFRKLWSFGLPPFIVAPFGAELQPESVASAQLKRRGL